MVLFKIFVSFADGIRGGIAPSTNKRRLITYGVVMGNGVAFTQADCPAPLYALTLK